MKKDFYKNVILDEKQQSFLKKFGGGGDFKELTKIMEMILQSRTFEVISSNLTREERMEELDNITGGYDLWRYLKNLMVKVEEKEKDIPTEDDDSTSSLTPMGKFKI